MNRPSVPLAQEPPRPARASGVIPPNWRRRGLWLLLIVLLLVAQSALVRLAFEHEHNRLQEEVETAAAGIVADLRQAVARDLQALQALAWSDGARDRSWRDEARTLLRERPELLRIERRNLQHGIVDAIDGPHQTPLFVRLPRGAIELQTELACAAAARATGPSFSASYFVPLPGGVGVEVVDVCLPVQRQGEVSGYLTASLALPILLDDVVGQAVLHAHELSFIDGDGTRLARAGRPRGAGIYVAERLIDLPGQTMRMRVDSASGEPKLIPNLAVALVLGLSLALGVVVVVLAIDVRRRAAAEHALAETLAFRKAMEDSLLTGLRARDLEGRVTYVNPAFSEMVGYSAAEIIGSDTPPYWPPEKVTEYRQRQHQRRAPDTSPSRATGLPVRGDSREGFETTFMRKNGERFAVMIFEAPLVDGLGRQTGWMSAALDVSDQRRIEELARSQQERLQATARLATVGEMASLLSHELNQPLAAIASYAAGSVNLLNDDNDNPQTRALLRQAIERIGEQAERAGRVIKSVHDVVRRRQQAREPVQIDALIDAVLPLVRLQARKSGTRIGVDIADGLPSVVCDRTMIEQVLLNLTRNGIQAMENTTEPAHRELLIRVREEHARWVAFSIVDRGPGMSNEVAQRLFTPFFTTRAEGMGLGLSLCRTVVEQHGGALDHERMLELADSTGRIAPATAFRFTLPVERRPARRTGSEQAVEVAQSG